MSANPTDVRPRALDLYRQMKGGQLYRTAYEQGMNLTTFLEDQNPQEDYKDGLDAFSRFVKIADIRLNSDPQYGIWADEFSAFDKDDNARALVPEWIARTARAVAYGHRPSRQEVAKARAMFLSEDFAAGGLMRPYEDDLTPQIQKVSPQIPLDRLVARTTGITGTAYRAFYLSRVAADLRMVRIAEATEIPRVKLTGGEHIINLRKFGRGLETSYEQLRRNRIDLVALFIQLMAVQTQVDMVDSALDVIVNGDGNSGTSATVHNLTTLDPDATAGTLSLKGYLRFKMKFLNPYVMTTVLAQEESLLQAFLLSTGNANIPLVMVAGSSGFGGFTPINPGLADNVAAGWLSSAPASKLVGFDNRFALEHVTEIGGDITEVERFVSRQTELLVMTTVDGFRVIDPFATNILNIAA